MELGNLLFGNSRGKYPINRTDFQDMFINFFESIGFNEYGYLDNSNEYGFENDVFKIQPYYWGEDEEKMGEPNFIYKPKNIKISWYKYMLRDAYSNIPLTKEMVEEIGRAHV